MISKNGITFEYKAEIQLRIQLLFCSGVQHCASLVAVIYFFF